MLGILSKMASALFSNTISISISTLAYGASANAEQRHATVEGKALQALLNGSGADTKHVPKITAGKPSPHEHP